MDDRVTPQNLALCANLGRPRTMLAVGANLAGTVHVARDRGAKVVALEWEPAALDRTREAADEAHAAQGDHPLGPVAGRRFDLVLFQDLDGRANLDALLRAVPDLLEDGGHVVLDLRPESQAAARGASLLELAGLEVLRTDIGPRMVKSLATASVHQLTHPTTFGLGPHVVWPLERVIGKAAPARFAEEVVVVGRKPPRKGPLSLTVGMLTLNEKESVERMIDDIRAVAPEAKLLLIDSSSDETPDLARAKGARVIRQLPPRGHGPAMERLMYEAASESDALIYIDCDFTYPTAEIPHILELLEQGADVVNASRTARYPKAMPVPNFLANRMFAATAQVVHGIPTTDVHSGMRGYRASVIRGFDFSGDGDALPLDTLILPARSNYHVVEYPIEYSERVGESKLAKLRGTVWTFLRIASAVGNGDRVRSGRHYDRRRS